MNSLQQVSEQLNCTAERAPQKAMTELPLGSLFNSSTPVWPILLAAVVLLGFAFRLYRLDSQSVWYDEVFALSVSRLPFVQMDQALIADLVHPPLHYYLLHWWFALFGFGPFQGRMLSVLFGTIAIAVIYVFARYLFERQTAIVAAILLAFSQLAIMYSQEARPYAQFLMLYLTCAYLFVRALRERRVSLWIGFLCLACLLVYTHYYGFLVLASFMVFGYAYRRRYALKPSWLLGGVSFLAVAYAPWLYSCVIGEALHAEKLQRLNTMAHVAASPVHWYTLATIINIFNNGRPNGLLASSPLWTAAAGGVLFVLPAILALLALGEKDSTSDTNEHENLVCLAFLCGVPIVLALPAGLLYRTYDVKYVAFCAAPYYVVVARGLCLGGSPVVRRGFLVAILAYSAFSLRANYFIAYKEDYKHALTFVAQNARPRDCMVVAPSWEERQTRWAWSIYEYNQPSLRLVPLHIVISGATGCERTWLISVLYKGTPPALIESESARQMLSGASPESYRWRFFWIDVDLYSTARKQLSLTEGTTSLAGVP